MKIQYFPYYWFLFPPCEGCTVMAHRIRPVVIIRPHFPRFRREKHWKKVKK